MVCGGGGVFEPSADEIFASSALLRPCVLLAASLTTWESQGGDSLPRDATRSSSLCVVALRRVEGAERSCCCGEEDEDEDDADDDDETNVANAPWGADEAAKSAAPATRAARTSCFCCFDDLRAICIFEVEGIGRGKEEQEKEKREGEFPTRMRPIEEEGWRRKKNTLSLLPRRRCAYLSLPSGTGRDSPCARERRGREREGVEGKTNEGVKSVESHSKEKKRKRVRRSKWSRRTRFFTLLCNKKKMKSPARFSFLFGLLLALAALAASVAGSSIEPPTSSVVPSVDPELNWLTPQEFKVKTLEEEKRRNRACSSSPSSFLSLSSFCRMSADYLLLRVPEDNSRSWALSKGRADGFRRQGQSPKAAEEGEKGALLSSKTTTTPPPSMARPAFVVPRPLLLFNSFSLSHLPPSLSTSSRASPPPPPPPRNNTNKNNQQKLNLKKNSKPIMYLFSRPGCSACDALKSTLGPVASPALKTLTKMFVVVHVQDPETLGDDKELRRKYASAEFEPHGNYVPRAMFADPKTGKVRAEVARPVSGDAGAEFPHFVSTSGELESAMRNALVKLLGNGKGLKLGSAPGEPLKKVERRRKRQARKKQKKESAASGSGSAASRAEM